MIVVGAQVGLHLRQQRFIGELHRTTQGVAEQFSTELSQERVAAIGEQVVLQAIDSV